MDIGTIIRMARRKKSATTGINFTQDMLAKICQVTTTHISNIENNKHSPTIVTLEKIAYAMNMELSITFKPITVCQDHSLTASSLDASEQPKHPEVSSSPKRNV